MTFQIDTLSNIKGILYECTLGVLRGRYSLDNYYKNEYEVTLRDDTNRIYYKTRLFGLVV